MILANNDTSVDLLNNEADNYWYFWREMAMRFRFLLSVGLILTPPTSADAACTVFFRFHLTSDGPWKAYGAIKQGKTCNGTYFSGGTMIFKDLSLVQAPPHGKVRIQKGGTYFYTAPIGYSGSDSFMIRVCGKEGSIEGCTNLSYNMTVQ